MGYNISLEAFMKVRKRTSLGSGSWTECYTHEDESKVYIITSDPVKPLYAKFPKHPMFPKLKYIGERIIHEWGEDMQYYLLEMDKLNILCKGGSHNLNPDSKKLLDRIYKVGYNSNLKDIRESIKRVFDKPKWKKERRVLLRACDVIEKSPKIYDCVMEVQDFNMGELNGQLILMDIFFPDLFKISSCSGS
jgi:hypothetical protein